MSRTPTRTHIPATEVRKKPKDEFDPRTLQIQKGVPIPGPREHAHSEWYYLFAQMEVGDSFEFPAHLAKRVGHAWRNYVDRHAKDHRFAVRKLNPEQFGIWRIQ